MRFISKFAFASVIKQALDHYINGHERSVLIRMSYPFVYFVTVRVLLYCYQKNIEFAKQYSEFILNIVLMIALTDIIIDKNP